jgi:hypothetical protein
MIKWTRLQLSQLPNIAVETDHAILNLECRLSVNLGLISKVSQYGLNEDVNTLNNLRESILKRIEALDKFY